MKKYMLITSVTMLAFCVAGESRADAVINCKAGQQSCGTNCCWSIVDDTLKVTGGADGTVGHMNDFQNGDVSLPWKDKKTEFTKVDIQGVDNVGNFAFSGFGNIADIKLGNTIKSIGFYTFSGYSATTIEIPDSVTTLDARAFSNGNGPNHQLKIIIPDSVNAIGDSAFGVTSEQLNNVEFICRGNKEKCTNLLDGYVIYAGTNNYIPVSLADKVSAATYKNCESEYYYWDGAECVRQPDKTKRKCCANCKDMGGWCNRVRWTPAEVAKVLRDDDTNVVTITFRIQ